MTGSCSNYRHLAPPGSHGSLRWRTGRSTTAQARRAATRLSNRPRDCATAPAGQPGRPAESEWAPLPVGRPWQSSRPRRCRYPQAVASRAMSCRRFAHSYRHLDRTGSTTGLKRHPSCQMTAYLLGPNTNRNINRRASRADSRLDARRRRADPSTTRLKTFLPGSPQQANRWAVPGFELPSVIR